MKKEMKTVEDWFRWRSEKPKEPPVEEIYGELTKYLGWECTDVLYSFPGVYAIGLLALYPRDFKLCGCTIRLEDESRQGQLVYSNEFLKGIYPTYEDLNNITELKNFIQRYKSIGNIYPIWPGGNKDKGTCRLYDLPEFYFKKYPRWAHLLQAVYPEAYLESVINLDDSETIQTFLNRMLCYDYDYKEYKKFLNHICTVIDSRENAILAFAREHGFDTSEYETQTTSKKGV